MGWEVIALGSIEFGKNSPIERIEGFVEKLRKTDFVTLVDYNSDHGNRFVHVEMSGNKGIDYEPLEKLCTDYKEIIDGTISFGEYSETGDGFYFDPQEHDNE